MRTTRRQGWPAPFALAALALPGLVSAATLDAVNRGRALACGRGADLPPLKQTRALDGAAQVLARGATLHQALRTLAVRPEFAASMRFGGIDGDAALAAAIGRRGCGDLGRRELREVGIARAGGTVYLVAVAPLPVPAPADRPRVEREVLARVNAARAAARRCGAAAYGAAPPVTLSEPLSRIAAAHSAAMGARDELAHREPDGSTPADRVRRGGYDARVVGENVASGVPTAADVVAGWLASPGHCANIMDPRFTEMGVSYSVAPGSDGAIYWTQLLAARRS